MRSSRPRLALPFTVLTAADTVRLVAGEDFRYTFSGAGIDEWLPGLLAGCDGRRTLDDLLRGLDGGHWAAARGLVDRLYAERVVVEGPAALAHPAKRHGIRAQGSGELLAGLETERDEAGEAVDVLCQDRLDYEEALRFNRRSLAGDVPWLWATYGPMSRGYVSPPFLPGAGPCLGCLIRHFQRLSPAAEIYDGLIDHARLGRTIEPVHFPAPGIEVLRQLIRWKATLLAEAEPPAALYRLHVLDALAMEVSAHRVFADPECPDCGEAAAVSGWEDSAYTGIFTRLGAIPPQAHDPDVRMWSGTLAPWGPRGEDLPVGGVGWDDEAARNATVGEGVERLQPYPLPGDGALEATHDEWPLDEPAIEPERWVLFHREQYALDGFPFRPFTRRTRCRWVCFRQALSGDPRWVPEELAYLFMPPGRAHVLCSGVSTGLSCGRAGQPVLLRGVQEVIERDAVAGAWWRRYPLAESPPVEVLGSLPRALGSRLFRPNLRYRFFRVGSPFSAHVTLVSVEGEEVRGFCLGVGSACRETLSASWLKSILEAVHGYRYVRYLKETRDGPGGDHPATFEEHALYYALHPERLAATVLRGERAMAAPGTGAGNDPWPAAPEEEDLALLAERLGKERPILFRSMTPPAIASEIGEWHVLKVLVPGLQPLHGNHLLAHLGGPLWAPRGLKEYAAMPPHPFP